MQITIHNRNPRYMGPWGFVAQVVVMSLAMILSALIIPSVEFNNVWTVIITAIVISLLNNFLRPILIVITLPFMVATLGLFLFIINTVIILMADVLVPGFTAGGFVNALLFSLVLTLFNYLLEIPNRLIRRPRYKSNEGGGMDDDDGFVEYEEVKDED